MEEKLKNRDDSMSWIPLWIDKWIFGSTRIELQPDERSVWVDLMAIASKDNGYIRANPETGYPSQQLAGLLCITEELLGRTFQRCLETNKIKKSENGAGYYIINWSSYQLTDRYKRRFQSNVQEKEHSSLNTEYSSSETEPIGEDRIGKKRIGKKRIGEESSRGELKDVVSRLSKKMEIPNPNEKERRSELQHQAQLLKESK